MKPHALSAAVGPAAVPHGFTIVVWGTAAWDAEVSGPPRGLSILLFVVGAVCGYALLVGVARLRRVPGTTPGIATPPGTPAPAVAVALGLAFFADHLVSGPLGWGLSAFCATVTYFCGVTIQVAVIGKTLEARSRRRELILTPHSPH